MKEKKIDVQFKGDGHLALWKIYPDKSQKGKNIFLTHGTFSDRKICMGVSEFLVKNGYTCWILEWRNHGKSSTIDAPYNFEKIGKEDIEKVLNYLFVEENIKQIDCITHSGGGISLIINLIENPENITKIKQIVFFACQSFGTGYSFANRLKLLTGKYLNKLVGFVPAKILGRPHNEDYYFMKQWFDWNLSKSFVSETGRNYALEMSKIQVPILSISGEGDKFVAPMIGCKEYLLKFENPKNKLLHCGKNMGFLEDYSHSRLIYSRNAEKEIYPEVLRWITQSDNAVDNK